MRSILFFLFFIFITNANASEDCYYGGSSFPVSINVEVNALRSFTKESLELLTNNYSYIPDKFKKYRKATITVVYKNGKSCIFDAKIRRHGDWLDHIVWDGGNVQQSLRVKLKQGNINGIVDFKLLIPQTRNFQNELIAEFLFTHSGLLAPRTYIIPVSVNGTVLKKYILQESLAKEFLENRGRKEAPIIEGNEKLLWTGIDRNNRLDGRFVNARLVSDSWAKKNLTSFLISYDAVMKGNRLFHTALYKNSFNPEHTSGNNKKLSRANSLYEAILWGIGGDHAFAPHNRVFYYRPEVGGFEPIYYDGNISFKFIGDEGESRFSTGVRLGRNDAIAMAKKLNVDDIYNFLCSRGSCMNSKEITYRIEQFINNLETMPEANSSLELGSQSWRDYIKNIQTDEIDMVLVEDFEEIQGLTNEASSTSIVISDLCKLEDCIEESNFINNAVNALASKKDQYGNTLFFIEQDNFSGEKLNTNLYNSCYKGYLKMHNAELKLENKNKIKFIRKTEDAYILMMDGFLQNCTIEVIDDFENEYSKISSNKNRYNRKLLTGCLTFQDIKFHNSIIRSRTFGCEDSVNIIRGEGLIEDIFVRNASADALDIDFSNLMIEGEININGSGNDCVDFSYSNISISKLYLVNCGDKAISVGEKSLINSDYVVITDAYLGIVSKDSAEVKIDFADVSASLECVSAYRKKQEFWGGKLNINTISCISKNGTNYKADKFSEIKASFK